MSETVQYFIWINTYVILHFVTVNGSTNVNGSLGSRVSSVKYLTHD